MLGRVEGKDEEQLWKKQNGRTSQKDGHIKWKSTDIARPPRDLSMIWETSRMHANQSSSRPEAPHLQSHPVTTVTLVYVREFG
jgi:hypothetical protein